MSRFASVISRVHAEDCAACETRTATLTLIERDIELEGVLDEEQRARLLAIANRQSLPGPSNAHIPDEHQDQTGIAMRVREHTRDKGPRSREFVWRSYV